MYKQVVVKNRFGIHAAIAAELYLISEKYKENYAFIKFKNRTVTLSGCIQVLALGVRENDIISIVVDGMNEKIMMQELETILQDVNR